MNRSVAAAAAIALGVLPASATWLNIDPAPCVTCTTFTQLTNSGTARWVNDYGTMYRDGSGVGRTVDSQLVGWFAQYGGAGYPVASGGTRPSGSSSTLANNNSLPISAGNGSSGTGQLYSFGTGTGDERALGSVPDDKTGNIAYGVMYRNNTGSTVDTLTVSYRGEQWRNSGNGAQSLEVSYAVFGNTFGVTRSFRLDPNVAPGSSTSQGSTWLAAGGPSTFTSPQTGGSATALDGNAAANSATLTFNLSNLALPAGGYVFIRWRDLDNLGADHGLAIDDVCVAVPEASTVAAIGAVGAVLGGSWWRARRRQARG
jgi:hypothetical protein